MTFQSNIEKELENLVFPSPLSCSVQENAEKDDEDNEDIEEERDKGETSPNPLLSSFDLSILDINKRSSCFSCCNRSF